jgi:hypothetical protein
MAANQQEHDERVGVKRRRQDSLDVEDTPHRRRGGIQQRGGDQYRRPNEPQHSYRGRGDRHYDRRPCEAEYSHMVREEDDYHEYQMTGHRGGGYGRGGGRGGFSGQKRPYSGRRMF